MSSKLVGSIAYSSGGRPATAFNPMFGSSAPMELPHVDAGVLAHELRRDLGVLLREPPFEQVGGLDHVIVDADQDEIFDAHAGSLVA